jgi:hypothetical protein
MPVIINELEIELEPEIPAPKPGGQMPVPEKPPFGPQDLLVMLDREERNHLRLLAH